MLEISGWPIHVSIMRITIILLGLLLAYLSFHRIKKCKNWTMWLYAGQGINGLGWSAVYLFLALSPDGLAGTESFGRMFILPLLVTTMALQASIALYNERHHEPHPC